MSLFKILKHNSKLALKGHWGGAVIILLIIGSVSTLLSLLEQILMMVFVIWPMSDNPTMNPPAGGSAADFFKAAFFSIPAAEWIIMCVTSVLILLLVVPLSLGVARWYYKLVHGDGMPVSSIFYYYESAKNYRRSIWYNINIGVRAYLWLILFYAVPSGILFTSVYFLTGDMNLPRVVTSIATAGAFLSIVMLLLSTLFYCACVCRYTLVPFLLAENDDISVSEAIRTSVAYTRGYRFSLMWFGLSYIGWMLLTIFLFPILYVYPYYSTGIAMYSRFIIEKNRAAAPDMTKEFTAPPEILPVDVPADDTPEILQDDDSGDEEI